MNIDDLPGHEISDVLAYSGLVLLAFELLKRMIVKPIVDFYADTTFGDGPFKSYEEDVAVRHKNQFEACLLYLRDFIEAIDAEDVMTIQALRKHRNELAHNLPNLIHTINLTDYLTLIEKVDKSLFKLSNYRIYMEIGADPRLRDQGIDWDKIKGPQYEIFEAVISRLKIFAHRADNV